MPPPVSHDPAYSTRLDEALLFVADRFRHRVRKGSGTPYLGHLLQVMVTVAEHGGNEDQLIAALLHDYLEDIEGAHRDEIADRWGERVAGYVEWLSDCTQQPKPPWIERKRAHLQMMAEADAEVKLILAADKLHNARSILADHPMLGARLWERFTASREQTLWYYRESLRALGRGWSSRVLDELRVAVQALERLED